ncbi:hypothetical protein LSAT2_019767 [Lamellibrachia satsuma]|nr:hypothetical protein LSAT2_019767 [Lamellibrachia satsuma]
MPAYYAHILLLLDKCERHGTFHQPKRQNITSVRCYRVAVLWLGWLPVHFRSQVEVSRPPNRFRRLESDSNATTDMARTVLLLFVVVVCAFYPPVNCSRKSMCLRLCDAALQNCIRKHGCGRKWPLPVPDKCLEMHGKMVDHCERFLEFLPLH